MLRTAFLLTCCGAAALWAQPAPFDVDALLGIARVGEHQLSPDGTHVAFSVQTVDVPRNARKRHIWIVPLGGGLPRQITTEGNSNSRPRWSPDSRRIAYISDRSGAPQVWVMEANGTGQRQVTDLATGAEGVLWSGSGQHLVFVSEVYPHCIDEACNKKGLEEEKARQVQARIYTSLLYRHWNSWQGARRKHLMMIPAEGGEARDLTPGAREVPPFSLGGQDDYAISPDGREVCFVMNPDTEPALSTNSELYVVPIEGGEARKITENPAADSSPVYSPDGMYLAYRAQFRPGYESDRWRLVVLDRTTGRISVLTEGLDRSVGSIGWAPDSRRLWFTTLDRGRTAIHMVPVTGGASRPVVSGNSTLDEPQFTPDGRTMVYSEQSGSRPLELYRAASGGTPIPLTHLNDSLLARHQLTSYQEFWVEGAEGAQVHSFLLTPAGFDPTLRYPVLFLIHGGPQGAWAESWSYRWNPQVFAGAGYVVVMPNPRGSTGYGQKFTDEINRDWGGRVYQDLMATVNHVALLPYVDPTRMAAAGGSYGGYMVNWMLGHTDRFKAFISHAGVYDLRSMAGETEELWFTRWEFGGMPWETPEIHERWSPSNFAGEFRTPTLVIHGELDYRVPVGQALQLFTALQVRNVPSKLVLFPDEGHWILKPQNSRLWYKTFLDWLDEWTMSAPLLAPLPEASGTPEPFRGAPVPAR